MMYNRINKVNYNNFTESNFSFRILKHQLADAQQRDLSYAENRIEKIEKIKKL